VSKFQSYAGGNTSPLEIIKSNIWTILLVGWCSTIWMFLIMLFL